MVGRNMKPIKNLQQFQIIVFSLFLKGLVKSTGKQRKQRLLMFIMTMERHWRNTNEYKD